LARTPFSAVPFRRSGISVVAAAVVVGAGLLAAGPGLAVTSARVNHASVHVVSTRMPMQGPSIALGARRQANVALVPRSALTPPGTAVNTWKKQANLPGAVVHDVDFPTAQIGYAAAELGQVWKTTNGGKTWTEILNRGFPYYYYGVEAVTPTTVVISGFDNTDNTGIISWSTDGGVTWSADQVLAQGAWLDRIRLPHGLRHALAMNGTGASGSSPNLAWYADQQDQWTQVTPDPNGGWFGSQFTLLKDHSAYASGITYCDSADTGATWACRNSIDSVFDGATEFVDDQHGWVGGGEISPEVAGWLHYTTDGGATWSDRVLNTAWPIRQIEFLTPQVGWATGGNIYTGVGGIYFTSDGGQTWSQDADTGDEVSACSYHRLAQRTKTRVWCIGDVYNGQFSSNVYRTTVPTPAR
jgi:photosystem II stability/assembly factor-like uncharacterized protein